MYAVAEGATGSDQVLTAIQTVRSTIPAWQRALSAAVNEAGATTPDCAALAKLLRPGEDDPTPSRSIEDLNKSATDAETTIAKAVGIHAQLLTQRLTELDKAWNSARESAEAGEALSALGHLTRAQAAAEGTMAHALFIAFVDEVRKGHTGESRSLVSYCAGWGLSAASVEMVQGTADRL
jgi:hypothetical protein